MSSASDSVLRTLAYHERTKHHPQRYARSTGYLDWETQPDPFRTYAGAPRLELPLVAAELETRYCDLYVPREKAASALDHRSLGAFFELALGLTAWKEFEDSRWALRSDPSSGNLHPTEGYVVLPELQNSSAGLFHYVSRDHCLEQRCTVEGEAANTIARRLPRGGFLIGLSSVHWREAWKYGERAFRYCQHDLGHVLGTLRFAAAALGWSAGLLDGAGDDRVARLLGLSREADWRALEPGDREQAEALVLVAPSTAESALVEDNLEELIAQVERGHWQGQPNELSPAHVDWDVIEIVTEATRKEPGRSDFPSPPSCEARRSTCEKLASTIIRQRRSAVALDGKSSLPREHFYEMLDALIPRTGAAPWDVFPYRPRVHLGLFVHRVIGLAPGLYLLERSEAIHGALQEMLGGKALWTKPEGCPNHLRLFAIGEVDVRGAAAGLSCGQEIAGAGAFSLGMFAEFRSTVEAEPAQYRRLFWEAGLLGQVLYLEAEAAGVRGTGIGCYFDDAAHRVIGLEGDRFQSLYHFTVGTPVEDTRLVTLPAYAHLER